jgi:hypothetical protein
MALVFQHRLEHGPARVQRALGHLGFDQLAAGHVAHKDGGVVRTSAVLNLCSSVFALVGNFCVDGFDALLSCGPAAQCPVWPLELAVKAPFDALARWKLLPLPSSPSRCPRCRASAGLGLHLDHHIEIPAPRLSSLKLTRPQLVVGQAVAVPQAEFLAGKGDLPSLVLQGPRLERNPAQAVFAALGIGDAPAQLGFFELLARFGVVLADLLHGGRADVHAVALAETIGQLLQVVATEPLVALTDGAAAGFVAEVPDLIDLARHRGSTLACLSLMRRRRVWCSPWHELSLV